MVTVITDKLKDQSLEDLPCDETEVGFLDCSSSVSVFFSPDCASWRTWISIMFTLQYSLLPDKCSPTSTSPRWSYSHIRFTKYFIFSDLGFYHGDFIFSPQKKKKKTPVITAPFNHQHIVLFAWTATKHMVHKTIFPFAFRMPPRSQTPAWCTTKFWALKNTKLPIAQT